MARELSLQELLTSSFEHQMAGINTCIPGVIVSVDSLENMLVTVQPTINMKFKDGQIQEWPTLPNTPIIFPSSSTSAVTFPLTKGDPVLIVFSMRGIDNFRGGSGYPTTPTDFRKFDLSDAFAIPAPWPVSRSINNPSKRVWDHDIQDMVMVHNIGGGSECEFRLKSDGRIQMRTSEDIEIQGKAITVNAAESINLNAPSLVIDAAQSTWIGNINHTGNYTGVGVQTFNGVIFSTHKHGTSPPPSN